MLKYKWTEEVIVYKRWTMLAVQDILLKAINTYSLMLLSVAWNSIHVVKCIILRIIAGSYAILYWNDDLAVFIVCNYIMGAFIHI